MSPINGSVSYGRAVTDVNGNLEFNVTVIYSCDTGLIATQGLVPEMGQVSTVALMERLQLVTVSASSSLDCMYVNPLLSPLQLYSILQL